MKTAQKLRILAEWLELKQLEDPQWHSCEVQNDLRKIANNHDLMVDSLAAIEEISAQQGVKSVARAALDVIKEFDDAPEESRANLDREVQAQGQEAS